MAKKLNEAEEVSNQNITHHELYGCSKSEEMQDHKASLQLLKRSIQKNILNYPIATSSASSSGPTLIASE